MAHSGINTYFAIGNAATPAVPVDRSTDLDNVAFTSEPDDLDGTTFQPGVANPSRVKVPGFRERTATLTGKWTASAETFWTAVEGVQNVNYEYGPLGDEVGKPLISGTCNVISFSGPDSSVDGVTTFGVELSILTRTSGTMSVELAERRQQAREEKTPAPPAA
jgi:ribosomal protein L34